MNRATFVYLILAPLVAIHAADSKPNIVILYADDMGYGDLGVQNPASKIPTPNLDRLASEGTRFVDAHSSSGVCTPSRYALLQGRYHWRKFHGIVNSFDQPILDAEKTTLPELLKSKGYKTACIGKWHLGWDWNSIKKPGASADKGTGFPPDVFDWTKPITGGPLSHGFDYYFGDDVPNFPPYAWFENDRVITVPTVPLQTPKSTAEGHWEARPGPSVKDWDFWDVMPKLTQKAVEWVGKQKPSEPFFLYFPFTSPHAPIVPMPEFVGKSKANGYGDFMAQTDDAVGRVLKALKDGGFAENTLVIFSADNGPEHYAYDRVRNFDHRSMGPLRGLKRDLWEGGHRVPFIVRWPNVVPAGQVNKGLISQIDLYATLANIVGAKIPEGSAEDSYDQIGCLKNETPSARSTLVHNTNANGYALRNGDWVLVAAKTGAVSKVPDWFDLANGYANNTDPGELYNLAEDLGQKQNLYAKHPDKVKELSALLEQVRSKGQVKKPNILLLVSDDHSYPFLSTYGNSNVKTPTLDQFAAEGMKFHRFFTGAPQCVPSRATLMTGRSAVAARMTRFSAPLPRDEITFPEMLRDKGGYFTGICGRSFHLDGAVKIGDAVGGVFQEYQLKTFRDRVDSLNTCGDNEVAEQVAIFLDKKPSERPFFMWANFSDPHHVWNAPAEFRPDPASLKLPMHWPDSPGMREQVADYCAEVNRVDRTIAGVLDVLKKRGLIDSTLIVFCGDNGAALPHGKGSLYDPGSNVPFLVRWPGVVKPGGDSRALISAEDLAPTLLAAAGIEPGPKMSGVSFLPLLKGDNYAPRTHLFVERGPHGSAPVSVNMSNAGFDLARAVRSDRYKFIYNCTPWIPYAPVDSAGGSAWKEMQAANAEGNLLPGLRATYFTTPRPVYELYDLDADPSELNNLSGTAAVANIERELREALAKKMILDFDYLPLPELMGGNESTKANKGSRSRSK